MYKPSLRFLAVLAAIHFGVSWIAASLIESLIKPNLDSNAEAFIVLAQAVESGTYAEREALARRAQTMASDPDIRTLADIIAREANLMIRAGSSTPEEAESFTGFVKSFLHGYFNPVMGLEAGLLAVEMALSDVEAIAQRVDNRYLPIFSGISRAETVGALFFWIVLIAGPIVYASLPTNLNQKLLQAASDLHWLAITKDIEQGNKPDAVGTG